MGELYLDFVDKLVTLLAMFLLIRVVGVLRDRRKKGHATAGLIALLVFVGLALAPATAHASTHAPTQDEVASDPSYIQRVYDADNGLPGGHANDIVQTIDGTLWVGNSTGLYRYTGSTFRPTESLDAVKNVNCLYADQEGRLWIGTNDNGLVMAIQGTLANHLNTINGMPSDSVTGIVQCADGDYYVGTSDRMVIVRIRTGFAISKVIEEVRGAVCVTADADGNVAVVTSQGCLYVLNDQKLSYEIARQSDGAPFTACAFDAAGVLYAGAADGSQRSDRTGLGVYEQTTLPYHLDNARWSNYCSALVVRDLWATSALIRHGAGTIYERSNGPAFPMR